MGEALGMIETRGLVAMTEALDAAVKSANVEFIGWEPAGSGMTCLLFSGNVAAVQAAVDAGAAAAQNIGEVVATHVIPRPHDDLAKARFGTRKPSRMSRGKGRGKGRGSHGKGTPEAEDKA
jgi:ethanolamine utilization protein EutM